MDPQITSIHPLRWPLPKGSKNIFLKYKKVEKCKGVKVEKCKGVKVEKCKSVKVERLKGVKIGKGAIIGSNSVVTKDVESWTVNVGNPLRNKKKLTPVNID